MADTLNVIAKHIGINFYNAFPNIFTDITKLCRIGLILDRWIGDYLPAYLLLDDNGEQIGVNIVPVGAEKLYSLFDKDYYSNQIHSRLYVSIILENDYIIIHTAHLEDADKSVESEDYSTERISKKEFMECIWKESQMKFIKRFEKIDLTRLNFPLEVLEEILKILEEFQNSTIQDLRINEAKRIIKF